MTLFSDNVSIAATSAGVSGTITVPMGARLVGINLAATDAAAAIVLSSVGIKWTGQEELKYVPQIIVIGSTNGVSIGATKTPMIRLPNLTVSNTNTVTITLTSTANITVVVGLMWIA